MNIFTRSLLILFLTCISVFSAKAQTLKADFSYKDSCQNVEIDFLDKSTAGSVPIVKWEWTFTQNGSPTVTYSSTDKTKADAKGIMFQKADTVTATLKITDQNNNTSTITRRIVYKANMKARFDPQIACSNSINPFGFKNVSTFPSGVIAISYKVYFGDGKSGIYTPTQWPVNSSFVTHKYTKPGPYVVSMVGYSSKGCKDSFASGIIVPGPALLNFDVKQNTCGDTALLPLGKGVLFINRSKENYSYNIKFDYDFGDGQGVKSPYKDLTIDDTLIYYRYASVGTYTVKLHAKTEDGCDSTLSKTITVRPNPTSDFTPPTKACSNSGSKFINKSSSDGIAWLWEFGDGKTSTDKDPVHLYTTQGNFGVKLTTTTIYGCKNTVTKNVSVIGGPSVVTSMTAECAGNKSLFFDYTSNVTVISRSWDFGDGSPVYSSTTATSTDHIYQKGGKYPVTITVNSDLGCQSIKVDTIVIQPKPDIGWITSGKCSKELLQYIDTTKVFGNDSIIAYKWTFFENPTTYTNALTKNAAYRFQGFGPKTIQLEVTTKLGCISSLTRVENILQGPQAIVPKPSNACNNTPVGFTATPQVGSEFVAWIFDDSASGAANISYTKDTTHLFKSGKTNYQVQLVLKRTVEGCVDTQVVSVDIYPLPKAGFEITDTITCANSPIAFNDTSDYIVNEKSRLWDFGNGATSTVKKPKYTFNSAGSFPVKLFIENVNGCRDSVTMFVTINPTPVADFSSTPDCRASGVQFTDNSTVSAGNIIKYEWDFGDGLKDSVMNPVHSFISNDTSFNVTLTVTTASGCTNTIIKKASVYPSPEPKFSFQTTKKCAGQSIQFTNMTTTVFGSAPVSYEWDFGDGNKISGVENPTNTYTSPGKYKVALKVTNDLGCTATDTLEIEITPIPVANFMLSYQTLCSGSEITFMDSSYPSGVINTWQWDFNDGNPPIFGTEVTKIFPTAGTFTVTLKVTTNEGCEATVSKTLTIFDPPKADFDADTVCFGEKTVFVDKTFPPSNDYIYSWDVKFGNKTLSPLSGKSPKRTFTAPGTYKVTLKVLSFASGCLSNTVTKDVYVLPKPTAVFSSTPESITNERPVVSVNSKGTKDYDYLEWIFSDEPNKIVANTPIVVHTFPLEAPPYDTGTFYVKLVAYKHYGNVTCSDTLVDTIVVGQSLGIHIPNAFTPSVPGDGINDYWKPKTVGEGSTYKVIVLNKWGQEVYRSNNINDKGWMGDFQGNRIIQPEGVYKYFIQITDFSNENIFKYEGNIHLLR